MDLGRITERKSGKELKDEDEEADGFFSLEFAHATISVAAKAGEGEAGNGAALAVARFSASSQRWGRLSWSPGDPCSRHH